MISSGFFNSIDGDRRYRAEDWAGYFSSFVSNGIFEDTADNLRVTASTAMAVKVAVGKAWINGYYLDSDNDINLTLAAANLSLDRIDRIIVRLNLADRAMEIALLTGIPSANANPPVLTRNDGRYELCLADISIPAGTTEIIPANITDTRADANLCGGVFVKTADLLVLEGKAEKSQAFDIGDIKLTARATAPTGWLICNGAGLSKGTYPELFSAIGYTYGGSGDIFNVPDLRGRVPVGFDSSQAEFNTLGKTGGAKAHTLTVAELAKHNHTYTTVVAASYAGSVPSEGGLKAQSGVTSETGSNAAHNNLQPYSVLNYIIYAETVSSSIISNISNMLNNINGEVI